MHSFLPPLCSLVFQNTHLKTKTTSDVFTCFAWIIECYFSFLVGGTTRIEDFMFVWSGGGFVGGGVGFRLGTWWLLNLEGKHFGIEGLSSSLCFLGFGSWGSLGDDDCDY